MVFVSNSGPGIPPINERPIFWVISERSSVGFIIKSLLSLLSSIYALLVVEFLEFLMLKPYEHDEHNKHYYGRALHNSYFLKEGGLFLGYKACQVVQRSLCMYNY